jgi:hypothetical protein
VPTIATTHEAEIGGSLFQVSSEKTLAIPYLKKNKVSGWVQWFISIIPATLEAKIGKSAA